MGEETRDRIGDGGEDPERGGDPNHLGLDLSGDHAPGLNPGAGDIGLDLCPEDGKGQINTPNPGLVEGSQI